MMPVMKFESDIEYSVSQKKTHCIYFYYFTKEILYCKRIR